MTDRELMQQALEAMMTIRPYEVVDYDPLEASITALREALADQPAQTDWEAVAADQAMTIALLRAEQPAQQEPVAWWNPTKDSVSTDPVHRHNKDCQPLYTSPPPHRKPLTDEELYKVFPAIATYTEANKTLYRSIARAIEAAHGIKEKNT